MQRKPMIKRLSTLIVICLFVNVSTSLAQALASNPSPAQKKTIQVDEEFLKELQKALVDRDRLKVENAAKDELLASKDTQIASWKGLYEAEKVISRNWKTAALNRKEALYTDDKMMAVYDKRVASLESDLSAARRNNLLYGAIGTVFGIAVGVVAGRK